MCHGPGSVSKTSLLSFFNPGLFLQTHLGCALCLKVRQQLQCGAGNGRHEASLVKPGDGKTPGLDARSARMADAT